MRNSILGLIKIDTVVATWNLSLSEGSELSVVRFCRAVVVKLTRDARLLRDLFFNRSWLVKVELRWWFERKVEQVEARFFARAE